jgi:hypothetical protein
LQIFIGILSLSGDFLCYSDQNKGVSGLCFLYYQNFVENSLIILHIIWIIMQLYIHDFVLEFSVPFSYFDKEKACFREQKALKEQAL